MNLKKINDKILLATDLVEILKTKKNKTTVFTNGCFDILHKGHIEYLAKASNLADLMIIGLNTDKSVSRLKGNSRPLQDENSRAITIAALQFVDYVVLFNEDTPYNLIRTLKPNVLVKGSDYKIEDIVGFDILKQYGGEIKTIDFVEGYSTTKIVDKILKQCD
jgi:rfaE bifunctional protein nucleotidyltransferase chain/domain